MVFTDEKCSKCGGAVAMQETFDLYFEDEFVCVNCGKLEWRRKDEKGERWNEEREFISALRGELVGPQNHSGVVLAIGGCKYKSKSAKKRMKKWKREKIERVLAKCGL
jgi:ssDNA-binding Zn-finger/Zn-ribbon topoisomerase 1